MAENYSFFNSKEHDRTYNANHWADYFAPLFKTGVFNGDLQVVENSGMSVKVSDGYAWIDGYAYHLEGSLVLDLETASGNMNRTDSIVLRLDLTNRWIRCFAVTGQYYAKSAPPPAPENTKKVHEIVLAHITVAAGTTEITQDMIADTRMDDMICGWVCSTVNQIKFEQIKAQFDAFIAKYKAEILKEYQLIMEYEDQQKADFEAWVESIKNILDEQAAGHLLLLIENAVKKDELVKSLAITEEGKVMDGKTCAEYIAKAMGTTLTGTLTAGETMIAFSDEKITDESMIDIYTDTYGVEPSEIQYEEITNTLVLTFDAQKTDVKVKVRVM